MANVKLVVSVPKTRRAFQKELDAAPLLGKSIGEKLAGEAVGLPGYEMELTGGSDKQGFPMRRDISGTGRKRALLSAGAGFHAVRKGQRKRKSVRGNTVSEETAQLNAKVLKEGAKPVHELWGLQPKEPKKAAKAEKGGAAPKAEGKGEKPEAKAEKPAEATHEKAEPAAAKPEHAETKKPVEKVV